MIDHSSSQKPAASFWAWFRRHSKQIEKLIDDSDAVNLSHLMSPRIDELIPGLAWEVGPGKSRPYLLTLSPEGDDAKRRQIDSILSLAPQDLKWEFHSSRQARNIQKEIELVTDGIKVTTTDWLFTANENIDAKKIDILAINKNLAHIKPKEALKAVFIFLDSALGEDAVEEWVGNIGIAA